MECLKKGGKVKLKQKQKQKQKQHQTVNVYVGQRSRKPKTQANQRRVRQQMEMPRFAMHDSGFQRLATPLTHNMPLNAVNAFEPARHIAMPVHVEPMRPIPLPPYKPSLVPTYVTPNKQEMAPGEEVAVFSGEQEQEQDVSSQLEDHTPFSQDSEYNKPSPLSTFGSDLDEKEEAVEAALPAYSDAPVVESSGLSVVAPKEELSLLESVRKRITAISGGKGGHSNRKNVLSQLANEAKIPIYTQKTMEKHSIEELKNKFIQMIDRKIAKLKNK